MAYISLYRKYRSQTFEDVVGQDHVVRTIRNAIKAGRIGQGYLFCGSRGTGKTTVARLIAKALNCEHGPTPDPCGVCEACVSIANGAAVDVVEMDAASNRGVGDVDALREGVKYPPMRLRYKVYIIDEAHQLSPQAKDAFLKTLEEPPPHAVFILATTESQKIPVTIRSRCQQFDFRRGTLDEIGDRLKHVLNTEGTQIEDAAVELIARSANGSYRDSLSLLEQVMAYTEGAITPDDVYTVLGMVDEDVLLELGDVLLGSDTAAAFAVADRLLREGRDVRELVKAMANHFRDVLALKVGADNRKQGDDRWRRQAEDFSQDRLIRIIDIFGTAEKELKWNDQHRLALEMALIKAMARPKEAAAPVPAAAPASQPRAVVTAPAPEPAPAPATEPAPAVVSEAAPVETPAEISAPVVQPDIEAPAPSPEPVSEPEPEPVAASPSEAVEAVGKTVQLSDVQRDWQRVLAHMQKVMKQTSVAACAREGRPVSLTDSLLTLGFSKKHGFHQTRTEQDSDKVVQAIQAVLGAKLRIVTTTAEGLVGGAEPEAGEFGRQPEQHPLLNDFLTTMDGKLESDDQFPWEE